MENTYMNEWMKINDYIYFVFAYYRSYCKVQTIYPYMLIFAIFFFFYLGMFNPKFMFNSHILKFNQQPIDWKPSLHPVFFYLI